MWSYVATSNGKWNSLHEPSQPETLVKPTTLRSSMRLTFVSQLRCLCFGPRDWMGQRLAWLTISTSSRVPTLAALLLLWSRPLELRALTGPYSRPEKSSSSSRRMHTRSFLKAGMYHSIRSVVNFNVSWAFAHTGETFFMFKPAKKCCCWACDVRCAYTGTHLDRQGGTSWPWKGPSTFHEGCGICWTKSLRVTPFLTGRSHPSLSLRLIRNSNNRSYSHRGR